MGEMFPAVTSDAGRAAATTRASVVYSRMREDILSGALPPNQHLMMEFLKERYQTGISPLREALSRLAMEKLVILQDRRGFSVAPISHDELIDLFETRCLVEEQALRKAMAVPRNFEWLEVVALAYHRLGFVPRFQGQGTGEFNLEWEQLHKRFHMALVSGCGLPTLVAFCKQLNDRTDRYRRLSVRQERSSRDPAKEHGMIFDAVMKGDVELAVKHLRNHYMLTARLLGPVTS